MLGRFYQLIKIKYEIDLGPIIKKGKTTETESKEKEDIIQHVSFELRDGKQDIKDQDLGNEPKRTKSKPTNQSIHTTIYTEKKT